MNLIEECEKLRELEQRMYPGHVDVIEGNGLREYLKVNDKLGDHHIATVECHVWTGQIGNERWPSFSNAKGIAALRNLTPAMLEVLGCFQVGDADRLDEAMSWMESQINDASTDGIDTTDIIHVHEIIIRMQKAAALMERKE